MTPDSFHTALLPYLQLSSAIPTLRHLGQQQHQAFLCHLISKEDGPAGEEDTYHHHHQASLYMGSPCINPRPTKKLRRKCEGTGEPSAPATWLQADTSLKGLQCLRTQ